MSGWTVVADQERCIGSGQCVNYAPGTFDQDETAKVIVRGDSTDGLEEITYTVEGCPTNALQLIVDGTG